MEGQGVESVDAEGRHPEAQFAAAEIEEIGTEIVTERGKGSDKGRGKETEADALEGRLLKGILRFGACTPNNSHHPS